MSPKPSVSVPDQFEIYNEIVRRSRRSAFFSGALVVVTLLAMGLAFLSLSRPLPVVVTSDNPLEPRRIVSAGDTSVREIDAKRFFGANARRLHGWSSATVVSELTDASLLMTGRWRKRFAAEVNADVKVPTTVDASGKATLLQTYVLARIRNELDIDWDTASCARAPSAASPGSSTGGSTSGGDGVWHCKADVTMKIEPLTGDPVDDPKLTKALVVRASFVEVTVSKNTVDGLLIDFWDAQLAGTGRQTKEKT
jgi:hypothetical protein